MAIEMNEVKEIINSEVVKEAYDDGLKPAVKNVGGILGTFTGFFNNVVLYPMKKLNIIFEQKAIQFQKNLEMKYNSIPEDKRCEPDASILGPALEVLKYNLDNDEIRIMFENLISNNMNIDKKNLTHPRFVDIIKLMSHTDAVIFSNIFKQKVAGICRPKIEFGNGKKANVKLPMYCSDVALDKDIFDVSASLTNLSNLGLIEIDFLRSFTANNYYKNLLDKIEPLQKSLNEIKIQAERLKNAPEEIQKSLNVFPVPNPDDIKITGSNGVIEVSDFGKMFAEVCLQC